jgi:hypothetical protein
MTGIVIGGIIWFVIAYLIFCLPLDLEIRKIRKERKNK